MFEIFSFSRKSAIIIFEIPVPFVLPLLPCSPQLGMYCIIVLSLYHQDQNCHIKCNEHGLTQSGSPLHSPPRCAIMRGTECQKSEKNYYSNHSPDNMSSVFCLIVDCNIFIFFLLKREVRDFFAIDVLRASLSNNQNTDDSLPANNNNNYPLMQGQSYKDTNITPSGIQIPFVCLCFRERNSNLPALYQFKFCVTTFWCLFMAELLIKRQNTHNISYHIPKMSVGGVSTIQRRYLESNNLNLSIRDCLRK